MLIGPATVITPAAVITDGAVVVDGRHVKAVGEFGALRQVHPQEPWVDAGGRTLTPGLINAHAHFYGMFARGISLKDPPPTTFREVLERIWWRLDKALDHRATYLSAALGGVAALRAGCTTVIDHHASPNAIEGSLDRIGEAVAQLGLRACLCYEVSDRDGAARAAAGIAENVRFARSVAVAGRLAAKFGLHAAFTLSDETLRAARAAEADLGIGFHIHCAEGPEDAGALGRLGGILGERSILAHCVHITEDEMAALAATGTTVTHQPHSNMGNAVGRAQVARMQELGVRTALGTDGYTWDLLESMRTAAVLHSHGTGRPGAGVGEMAHLLLEGNARLASATFGQPLGAIIPGAAADLVLWDYYPPTPVTAGNLPWHMQFGMAAPQVHTVWVDGQVVLRDRLIPGVDEEALAREARALAGLIWERF